MLLRIKHQQANLKLNHIRRIPTDRLIHSKSEHPESFKCNIPFAQTLRLRRICTADKEFQLNCNELQQKLTEWGHKGHIKGRK